MTTGAASFSIRFGVPDDLDALRPFERTYFPAVPGEYHAGYLFDDKTMGTLALTESIAAPKHAYLYVAEADGAIIGFAAATPSRLPGRGTIDNTSMVLQHIAVDAAWRRRGVASALLEIIEQKSVAARQDVIIAHVPESAAAFYRHHGWQVLPEKQGFGWLPFRDHIRADVADPKLGFPLMAAKVLRPGMIQDTFHFSVRSGAPIADAVAELNRLIGRGVIERGKLNAQTQEFLDFPQPPASRPGAAFGIR